MAERENGTVKWFNLGRGYGFIERDKGGDVFLHANEMADPAAQLPQEKERLSFEVVQGQKGPAASQVRRLSE